MFLDYKIDPGFINSNGNDLSLSSFASGLSLCIGVISLFSPTTTGSISQLGNSYIAVSPYISPDKFKLFFGDNAIQTANSLIISKSDLPGLTQGNNNTPESILVGLIALILKGNRLMDTPKISFYYWGYGVTAGKRIDTVLINMYKLPASDGNILLASNYSRLINPNDY